MTRSRLILDRRRLLLSGLAGAGLALPGARAAFAQAPRAEGRKLIVVILRGALDGLAALAPVSDPRYAPLRGSLGQTGGADVGEGFRLHPSLENLADLWRAGEALALHAAASPYRERSHFDGQDVLESGAAAVGESRNGWLNRALALMGGAAPSAIAVGQSMPLILRGAAPASTWAPEVLPEADDDTISRLMDLYAEDETLSAALAAAIETDAAAEGAMEIAEAMGASGPRRQYGPQAFQTVAYAASNLLTAPQGPDVAVVSFDGWDTHFNQGAETGQLANRLSGLDAAIAAFRQGLGAAWAQSAILVTTEFGRTVRENGSRGTDHGTGGVHFLLGGAVRGGRMIGDWPGLSRLYQDRDLVPANDLRALFKGVLAAQWGLDRTDLDQAVFPGSAGVPALNGLIA